MLDILGPAGKAEAVAPGRHARLLLGRLGPVAPWNRSAAETTALVALAYAQVRPQAPELDQADRLAARPPLRDRLAARTRPRARPWPRSGSTTARPRRRGPLQPGRHGQRHRGLPGSRSIGTAEGKAVARAPRRPSRPATRTACGSHIEGRGTFGYAVDPHGLHPRLRPRPGPDATGPPGSTAGSTARPTPSSTARPCRRASASPSTRRPSRTTVSQVALGGKARVGLDVWRNIPPRPAGVGARLPGRRGAPARRHDADRGLGQTSASLVHAGRRRAHLLLRPRPVAGRRSSYDVYGYLPGQYRALPASIRSAYEPGPVPPRPRRRPQGARPRRAERPTPTSPRPTSSTPAARPTSTPAGLAEAAPAARGAVRRLHAPRRRRQGRRADAPADPHQGVQRRARSCSTSRSSRRRPPSWSSPSTSCW